MAEPNRAPLVISPNALRTIIEHCMWAKNLEPDNPREACGFVFGPRRTATTVVAMANTHPAPRRNWQMSPEATVEVMTQADHDEMNLLCVYHSHPESAAKPSETDMASPDHSPAYLIVSLEDPHRPTCRAWRYDLGFVGVPRATEVQLVVREDSAPPIVPEVPWALTPGNRVLLTYQRPSHVNRRTMSCEITEVSRDSGGRTMLSLKSTRGTDPRVMLIERIKEIRVLEESPAAGRVRQRAAGHARALADAIEQDQFTEAATLGVAVVAAFPEWLVHAE